MYYKNLKDNFKKIRARRGMDSDNDNTNFDYLSSIAIKNNNLPFEAIGPVRDHLKGEIHSEFFSLYPNITIENMVNKDPYNLPATCDRELYHGDRHYDWWLSGLLDYFKIMGIMEKYNRPLRKGDAVYEMGCASGRVLRHFAIQQCGLDVWGSDINNRHIEWMRLNLPENIKIFQNTILPQIPLESNSIDIACAFSVFTHIDDLDLAWICEIRRVLKRGGIFYATIHSDDTWSSLREEDQIYQSLLAMSPYIDNYKITKEFLAGPLPKDKTVFSWRANNYNTNVFHRKDYIRKEWGRFFKVHEIIRAGAQYQDVVVMQKLSS